MTMIGRLSCLPFGLMVVCFRSVLGRTCDPLGFGFTDVASRTYSAGLVVDATVHRVPEGRRRAAKEVPVRFRVNDVLKGHLDRDSNTEKYPAISVGNFSVRPNPERCVAPLPQVGSRYVLFLNSTTTNSHKSRGNGGNSSSAANDSSALFLISSLPVEFSDEVVAAVRSSSRSKYGKKPRLKTRWNESLALQSGATLRLQCVANGRPKPRVLWYNNETLLHQTKHVTFQDNKRGSTLLIRKVTLADAGIYRCQAVNVVGRTSLKSINGIAVTVTDSSSHAVACERQVYCLNGGTCMILVALQDKMHCRCVNGFTGMRCEEKVTGIANVVFGKGLKKKF